MPSFDGINLVITLDSGVTNLDWIEIYSDWKSWLLESPENRRYPEAFRTTGGDILNDLLNSGSYWFLMNDLGWRMRPPEEDITVYVSGNLAPNDSSLPIFVPTIGGYTAAILGLQPVTQGFSPALGAGLRHGLYNDGVSYDADNGYAGTGTAPNGQEIGTPLAPSNNIPDSKIIADTEGFTVGYILSDLTFDLVTIIHGFTMIGRGKDRTVITVPAAASVTDCTYKETKLTGTLDGESRAIKCLLENVDYVTGEIENCRLSGVGEITLGGGGTCHFISCYSGKPGVGTPTINCGGSGQALGMRDYNGGILLKNKTGTDDISIDLQAGQVRLDLTTVTNGTIVVRGDGKLVDDATDEHIWSGTYGSLEILNETNSVIAIMTAVLDTSLVDHQEHLTLGGVNVRDTYNGVVEIDLIGGGAGQTFPTGMPHQRVNNIPDALVLLDRYHLSKLKIHGDLPIPESTNLNGITFISGATLDRLITIPNTCTTNGTKFRGIVLDGYINGRVDIFNCEIENLYQFQGLMKESTIFKNITCIDVARASLILDCVSGGVSANWPTLDVDDAKIEVRGYCGNLEVLGKTSATVTAIGMDCGILKLADTNVAGTIMVGGIGHLLEDNTGVGCTVDESYLLNDINIAETTWNHTNGLFLVDIIKNKKALIKNVDTWELIVYNDAGDTQILNKELKDKDGNDITDLAAGALAQELSTSV